jgi:hypothetical protein
LVLQIEFGKHFGAGWASGNSLPYVLGGLAAGMGMFSKAMSELQTSRPTQLMIGGIKLEQKQRAGPKALCVPKNSNPDVMMVKPAEDWM